MPSTQRVIGRLNDDPSPETKGGVVSSFAYDKKSLGAFYTPAVVAYLLSKWAIRSHKDRVLEPGFGGCEFLEAAVNRLKELGCTFPQGQLVGCDIDPAAFGHLADKLGTVVLDGRYLCKDFLDVHPDDFSITNVDVVIGNPPYVSHHNMSSAQKNSACAWRDRYQIQISGRASLWAYFILHALKFLRPGGRMAWVLPGSLVHSNYGREVLKIVMGQFSRTHAISLNERVFLSAGTEERTVVLLCDGFGLPALTAIQLQCESVSHLSEALDTIGTNTKSKPNLTGRNSPPYPAFLSFSERFATHTLGDIARVLIGTVTGANKFFVLSPSRAQQLGINDRYLRPIVTKFGDLDGAVFTDADTARLRNKDRPCLLFHLPDQRLSDAVRLYLESFPADKRLANSTFSRRADWLAADDGRIPDAFLSYMMHAGPRMALNSAGVNCTNTVHRIYFNQAVDSAQRKLACISLCTTFSQLSAELVGRSYGSGVLKIEPTEAKQIRLYLPNNYTAAEIDHKLDEFDLVLRSKGHEHARVIADEFIFPGTSPEISSLLEQAKSELLQTRKMRVHQRRDK